MRRAFAGLALGIALATGSSVCVATPRAASVTPANERKAAPDFALQNDKGALLKLSEFKGKVVVLDFWATWCHGCKLEIPWFMEFEKKYKDSGLVVIGVSMDADGWKSVKPYVAMKKMNYPVVIGNDGLAQKFGLSSMPMTLLIDREGKVADKHVGVVDKSVWESEIRTLLQDGSKAFIIPAR